MSSGFERAGGPPPLPPPPRRWWPWTVGALVLVAAIITAIVYRPFPTEEEKKFFGFWYGSEWLDTDRPRAWIAHFREDGRLHITFGEYSRSTTGFSWLLASSEEVGSWRVRDGVQCLASEDPRRPSGWWQRIERMQNSGDWRRVHYYRVTQIDDREMRYQSVTDGHDYRTLRSSTPVALPSEPLPPEKWPVAAPAR